MQMYKYYPTMPRCGQGSFSFLVNGFFNMNLDFCLNILTSLSVLV
jgi:hypothetical protein